jgi:hypothetical protein
MYPSASPPRRVTRTEFVPVDGSASLHRQRVPDHRAGRLQHCIRSWGVQSVESRLDLISAPFGAGDDRRRCWRCEPCTPPNHVVFRWPIICGSSGLTSFEVRFFGR